MTDISLFYEEAGKEHDKVFVLLHGNGEDHYYFQNQMQAFAKYAHVFALDTRGHGASPRGEKPFTIWQFAEDLKDFLDEKQIHKIYLLGFSDGANIALQFVLNYPNYVEKLILNGANLSPSGVKKRVQIPICMGYLLLSFISLFDKHAVRKKEILGLMVTQPNINAAMLANVKVRTLVLVGTHDMILPAHTKKIYESLPNAVLAEISGDHFIAFKNADEFNRVVAEFLEK